MKRTHKPHRMTDSQAEFLPRYLCEPAFARHVYTLVKTGSDNLNFLGGDSHGIYI